MDFRSPSARRWGAALACALQKTGVFPAVHLISQLYRSIDYYRLNRFHISYSQKPWLFNLYLFPNYVLKFRTSCFMFRGRCIGSVAGGSVGFVGGSLMGHFSPRRSRGGGDHFCRTVNTFESQHLICLCHIVSCNCCIFWNCFPVSLFVKHFCFIWNSLVMIKLDETGNIVLV